MKFIWDRQAQPGPDGKKYIRYAHNGEIIYLYRTGFVDVDKFSMEEWTQSFNTSKKSDGSFWVNEEQWMQKGKFLYTGAVGQPFDPMTLKEGLWKKTDFEALIKTKILPALDVDEKTLRSLLPNQGVISTKTGDITLTLTFKTFLQRLVIERASPAQYRAASLKEAQETLKKQGKQAVTTATTANTPKTSFSIGPSSAQHTQDQLAKLLSKK